LRMAELRDLALGLMNETGEPHFTPEVPYAKVYTDWLENLRDWTISRQLWWGHQIPAWYDDEGNVYVARSEEEARATAGTGELTQDQDVLDTWFSSQLWPFSTLGWPDETEDLRTFYPTSVLVTARDIIFLWVSRMVMSGMKFLGQTPFHDVFVTGTVLDKHGQRMSKTKLNGIDPLDVFDKYGVDATRLVLASNGSTDTRWNDNQVESYRNFANKIWNAARFCLMNSEGASVRHDAFKTENGTELPLHDRWILSRLNRAAREVNDAVNGYQFHEAVQTLYHFFWDDFCDWYIELSKESILVGADTEKIRQTFGGQIGTHHELAAARSRLLTVLEQALRLLHPFMPFITEELWLRLPGISLESLHTAYRHPGVSPTIMLTQYPSADEALIDERVESEMKLVMELISRIRNIRTELNVKPGQEIRAIVNTTDERLLELLNETSGQIFRLTRASVTRPSQVGITLDTPRASARAVLTGGTEVAVPLEGLIDFEQERGRLTREREKLQKEAAKLEAQLANPQFAERAPAEKVDEVKERLSDIAQRAAALAQMAEALK